MNDPEVRTLTDGTNSVRVLTTCPKPMFLMEDILKLAGVKKPSEAIRKIRKTDPDSLFCEAWVLDDFENWTEADITNLNGACGLALSVVKESPVRAYRSLKTIMDLAEQLPGIELIGSN